MEKFNIENDIRVLIIEAESFPEGVMDAHKLLHSKIPFSSERRYFGISSPDKNGEIIYKAAAEVLFEDESSKFDCETFIINKGEFNSIYISDFMNNIQSIGQTFLELLSSPEIEPNGYCLEWYINAKDVLCMVKLNEIL
jgi:hypothetical protein